MALINRLYVPSRMLIRALSRPLPPQCHLIRATPMLQGRNAGTKASEDSKHRKPPPRGRKKHGNEDIKFNGKEINASKDDADDTFDKEYTDEELNNPHLPVITFYERDLDKGGPDVLVKRIATPQDRRKERDMWKMMKEWNSNPDYDPYHIRKAFLEDMLVDPRYKEFADMLKAMKETLMTKEEETKLEKMATEDFERLEKEAEADFKTGADKHLGKLLQDSSLAEVHDELGEFQEKLKEFHHDLEHPEVTKAMEKLNAKFSANPELMKSYMNAEGIEQGIEPEEEDFDAEKALEKIQAESDGLTPLLTQMRDVMAAMGGSEDIENEINQILNEKIEEDGEAEDEEAVQMFDYDTLSTELSKLTKKPTEAAVDGKNQIDPALEAKVDKILADPDLLKKLASLQKAIENAKSRQSMKNQSSGVVDITQIPHEMAPDPENLPAERTINLQQRMEMARNDPEHAAALTRLHVDLPPPFNISPALRAFNQAIELAYLGANDDIRRILWRAYVKVRTLPTFLQNVSDDVWDLLYYSQAVTWKTNQNREAHLTLLLQDLDSVGKEGPPTHPSTFAKN